MPARALIMIAGGLLYVGARACVSARGSLHALHSIGTPMQPGRHLLHHVALLRACVVIVSGLSRTPPYFVSRECEWAALRHTIFSLHQLPSTFVPIRIFASTR